MTRPLAAIAATLLSLSLAGPALCADDDPVAATVNGVDIRLSEVLRIKNGNPQLAQAPMKVIYPMLLDNLIREQLLAEAGRKEGLEKDPDIQAAMKRAEVRFIAETYALRTAKKSVTDQMVKDRYAEMKKNFKPVEEVRARHILVGTQDEANAVLADLKKGKKFEEVAVEKSKDGNAGSGGDLGFFRKDEMVPEFSEAAFKLKPGQTSQAVQTQFGWHVIKSESKRMSQAPAFDEVKDELKAQLAEESLGKMLKNMVAGAKIARFDHEGKPLPPPAPPPAKQ
ncbi:MAG: peptidyl-prolyl cis-trans isomerase [Rhodospirillales bacterium]|jgi:peptidyl-prolyl cis-trans isomerase C|nr:peptidyl-prolyl cis-trans isomerase [Rhodospirillales bacterium]MDK9722714.1 peptidylprolyl isomerase [Rhodospirillales bacterium]